MGALIVFGLVLAVMGGGIAYAGDRLGSYIGKKRHSSFGLRPRHTAMLWTVVSGGGVAVLTLLLFLALNHAFSVAVVRGPQLLTANAQLAKQNKALTQQSLANERQAAADSQRAAKAQADADAAQAQAANVRADLSAVAGKLGQARQNLQQARRVLTNRQKALADAQAHLAEARQGLGTTRTELAGAQRQVRQARTGVVQARRQVQEANNQLAGASRSVLALGIRQDQLSRENLRMARENTRLARQNAAQQDALAATQGRPLVLRREEELGRVVVKPDQSLDDMHHALAVFLDRVELTARKRGAGGTDNSPAIIVPAPGETVPGTGGGGKSAREAALEALAQSIAAQGETLPSIVVVANARYNTFKGEPVHVDLRPYANLLVFPKGQVIAQGTLNGAGSEDAILRGLQLFLTGPVRAAALQRGIIPLRDPQSGEPQVGEPIDSAESLALVHQVHQAGANARLTASVAEDTYSADLLRLNLRVSPAPAPPEPRPVSAAGQ